MNPDYSRLTPAQALDACDRITQNVQASNPFNLDDATVAHIGTLRAGLALAVQQQALTASLMQAKTEAKNLALRNTGLLLSAAAKTALASGATDVQLREIGMARPARPTRPTSVPAPTGLTAEGFGDGSVRLAWGRAGSPQGTTFAVEWSADGLAWEMVEATTRASLTMMGYAPGVAAWFRVSAKRSGLTSAPSGAASVYAPGVAARVQLKVA